MREQLDYKNIIMLGFIAIIMITVMMIIRFESYKDGQADALAGKWKYEIDVDNVKVKRIKQ